MPETAAYDAIADQYASFVRDNLVKQASAFTLAAHTLVAVLGHASSQDVCDLACGEGHLSVALANRVQSIVGIDLSADLISIAQAKHPSQNVTFVVDDAQTLSTQADGHFDCVISNLALMDIPDLQAVYRAVFRVLRPSGRFVFSITHPCFQTPKTSLQVDENNRFVARQIAAYTQEGFWRSDNPKGIRGQVGAFHRTLSTYLNTALQTGFMLAQIVEPTPTPQDEYDPYAAGQMEVPAVMVVALHKS